MEGRCPIPDTHRRLTQAFLIFEDINTSYQNPVKFTGNLNNLIQALRNITFILQAEKSKIPDFDVWYEPFRLDMKSDEAMRWLVESRNRVVKQGDLAKKSTLSVAIRGHFEKIVFSAEYDPLISIEEAAERFRNGLKINLPIHYQEELLLEIERKWTVVEFPNAEIIDILIYCFSLLVALVAEAHIACSVDFLECPENTFVNETEDFMVLLRNKLKKYRIIKVLYKDGAIIREVLSSVNLRDKINNDESLREKAKKRYGLPDAIISLFDKTSKNSPFNNLKYHSEMAKHLFKIDKHLVNVAFLYFPDQPSQMISFELIEPHDRFLMGDTIAEKIEESHCKALIYVGEIWRGKIGDKGDLPLPPRLQEDRKEALMIIAAAPKKLMINMVDFERDGENITFGETYEKEVEIHEMPLLAKTYEIWEYQDRDLKKSDGMATPTDK
jgi:hypothetical protein